MAIFDPEEFLQMDDDSSQHPPIALLVVAGVIIAISASILFASNKTLHLVGYALAGVLAPIAVIVYRAKDRDLRTSSRYVFHKAQERIAWVILLLGMLFALFHALQFAEFSELRE